MLQRTACLDASVKRGHYLPPYSQRFALLVGLDGLEPSTSRLSGARSSHLSYRPLFHSWAYWFAPLTSASASVGGDDGIRTHDPLLAGQVLSQLSYTPTSMGVVSLLFIEA